MHTMHVSMQGRSQKKKFLLRQRLATCIGRQAFGRERVRGTLGFRGMLPQVFGGIFAKSIY